MNNLEKLAFFKTIPILNDLCLQIDYALQLNKYLNHSFDNEIDDAICYIYDKYTTKHIILEEDYSTFYKILSQLCTIAKSQTVHCVAHAHLDMNWLWGFDETVSITLSTVETMLNLLDAYTEFTFSQSQGAVYEIVEKYRPDLLSRIKKYIKLKKWEVTAGSFVETDKNLSSCQSQINQILYNKDYLSKLLNIDKDDITIDFEPDSFGHNVDVPEILGKCGIKYYYHCRGNNIATPFYYWQGSTEKILVYREPQWYNNAIDNNSFLHIPDFCNRYNVTNCLKVYGVGNHGGGATVNDIEKIIHLSNLPLMPNIIFSRYIDYYKYLSTLTDLKTITGEQNMIFNGCYASQSKIKLANANNESMLKKAQIFSLLSCDNIDYKIAKRNILFNQFHDILPGSGKEETRNHAIGLSQETNAYLGADISKNISNFIKNIDTESLFSVNDNNFNTSIGAGVGYTSKNCIYLPNYSSGKERAFVLFNPTNKDGIFNIELNLWDYNFDIENLECVDSANNTLPLYHCKKNEIYWSHNVNKLIVQCNMQGYEYKTVIVKPKHLSVLQITYPQYFERQDIYKDYYILENNQIRATFNKKCSLISMYDKNNKSELLSGESNFMYSKEEGSKLMSAWVTGERQGEKLLNDNTSNVIFEKNNLFSSLSFRITFENSWINAEYRLDACADYLQLKCSIEFCEKGTFGKYIPRIDYVLNTSDALQNTFSKTPLQEFKRQKINYDTTSLGYQINKNSVCGIMLGSKGKYSFRSTDNHLSVCLLRASFDPDPLPEYGQHEIEIMIAPSKQNALSNAILYDSFIDKPFSVSTSKTKGPYSKDGKILDIKNGYLSAIDKKDGNVYYTLLNPTNDKIICEIGNKTSNLYEVDYNNHKQKIITDNKIIIQANSLVFIKQEN